MGEALGELINLSELLSERPRTSQVHLRALESYEKAMDNADCLRSEGLIAPEPETHHHKTPQTGPKPLQARPPPTQTRPRYKPGPGIDLGQI